jgi:very-short-patch-repair endonuclease
MAEICANPEYRKLLSQRTTLALAATDTRSKMAVARSKMPRTMTVPHKKVCDILTALDIRYEVEYPLGFYTYDLFLPEHKILIEVQGNYWHSLPNAVRNDKAKATYIERYQPELKLQYIWEHECLQPEKVLEKIKYWTGISKLDLIDYDFNSLKIGPVDKNEADTFLYTWHHQFHGRHGIDYGVYLQDQLISIARFTNTGRLESATQLGFKSNEVLELMRLCVHPKYQKKNLLTWFLSRVEKDLKQTKPEIKCLISFADTGHGHTGAVYKAANWTKHSVVPPSYHYIDLDGYVMHKRTLYSHAVKMKMKEAEYAEKYSFYKVPGMEKIKFIKYLR